MSRIYACAPLVLFSTLAPSVGISEWGAATNRNPGSFDQTDSVFMTSTMTELSRVCAEADKRDWNGLGSPPVSPLTAAWAGLFLESIPSTLPAPEIFADVDGEIRLQWLKDPNWVFEVSINDAGTLSYARRFGSDAQNGAVVFAGTLPRDVERNLRAYAGFAE